MTPNRPPSSLRRRVLSLPTLLSFGLAIGVLALLVTRFDLDWSKTWANVKAMDARMYALALVLYYVSFGFRGVRWRTLAVNARIQDLPGAKVPSVWTLSRLIIIGWFVNSVAWLRMGDAYRAWALAEDTNGDFSWSLGTVLAERVVDMVAILLLLIVGVLWFSATRDSGAPGYVLGAATVMAVVLVSVLAVMKAYGAKLARFLPGRLEEAYERFQTGTLGGLRQIPYVFALGVAGWLLELGRLYFVTQALDLPVGVPLVLIASLGHAILSTVPTPGGGGAVEPGVTGILMLGLAREDAASIARLDRTITYISVIVIGGLVFLAWQVGRAARSNTRSAAARSDGD